MEHPINEGNRKVLIFSAFSDTAEYLYENVAPRMKKKYGLDTAMIMGSKEVASSGSAAFKVNQYYHTEWLPKEELPLRLDGLNIDTVYENFVRQIAGEELTGPAESLRDSRGA